MGTKQRRTRWLLGLIGTAWLLACASAQQSATTKATGTAAKSACFSVRDVESFSPLHASFVYVRLLRGEEYLLTLDAPYTSLPYATGLRISNEFSRICSDSGAMITFMDSGRPVFCRIIRVEAVASREAAVQIVKDRTAPGSRR